MSNYQQLPATTMDSYRNLDYINRSSNGSSSRRIRRISGIRKSKVYQRSTYYELSELNPRRLTLFNHILKRDIYGYNELSVKQLVDKHLSRTMPPIFREHELNIGSVNKVFAAQWINDQQVVMGTKCNKILIKDVNSQDVLHIPSLKGSGTSRPAECPCGIHSIAINPSKTLLATGAENTNDLAVYSLPSFDPVVIGEGGHTDWIFDIQWIDDEYCFTGSRDSKLALWRVAGEDTDESRLAASLDNFIEGAGAIPKFGYSINQPVVCKKCDKADKIRALAYNHQSLELGVLSLNSRIHTWDVCTFRQKESRDLHDLREAVCMTYDAIKRVYAIGSQSHVTLIDRDLKPIFNIESLQHGYGIRSVSFNNNILTIGTGVGSVLFYDMNAGKYLQCCCGQPCILTVGSGFLLRDNTWRDIFSGLEYHNAIYTHCYDETGCRLFTAGGPLPACLSGNYAGLWQ